MPKIKSKSSVIVLWNLISVEIKKTGTSKVGGISKAQNAQNLWDKRRTFFNQKVSVSKHRKGAFRARKRFRS